LGFREGMLLFHAIERARSDPSVTPTSIYVRHDVRLCKVGVGSCKLVLRLVGLMMLWGTRPAADWEHGVLEGRGDTGRIFYTMISIPVGFMQAPSLC